MTAHVQSIAQSSASGSTSPTLAFGSNVTSGNLICGHTTWNSTTVTLDSVTDSLGNTYSLVDNPVTNIIWGSAMFYAPNITGGSATLTFHYSGSVQSTQVIHEVSGCDLSAPLDVHGLQAQNSVTAAFSPTVTTSQIGDYIFGGCAEVSSGSAVTSGSGYVQSSTDSNVAGCETGEYISNQSPAGSTTATFNVSPAGFTFTGIMAFKAAASGGGPLTDGGELTKGALIRGGRLVT